RLLVCHLRPHPISTLLPYRRPSDLTIPSDVFDPQNPTPPLHPAWGINLNGVEGFRISENQYDAAGVEEEEISYAWGCIIRNSSRSEEHTSELQSRENLACRLLLGKK